MRRLCVCIFVGVFMSMMLPGCGHKSGPTGGAKAKKPMDVLTETLQVSDDASLKEIYRLLESAVFKRYGTSETERRRDPVYDRIAADIKSKKRPSEADVARVIEKTAERTEARKKREKEDAAKSVVHLLPEESLEKAWEILHAARPELNGYDGRKLIADSLHSIWAYSRSLYFKKLPALVPPPGFEPPPVDQKFQHFFTIKSYSGDPVFKELREMDDAALPLGAALPLLSLRRVADAGLKREGYGDLTDDELVKRYAERMLPAMIEYLAHPRKYGVEDTGYPPIGVLAIARTWPDEAKQVLQKQAFLSGWDDAYTMLRGPYTAALLEEFKDSPFGAPDRP